MKTFFFSAIILLASFSVIGCGNNTSAPDTHTHDDGSTHADHDTTKPAQQEFVVGDTTARDTTAKEHTHEDGEKHSH